MFFNARENTYATQINLRQRNKKRKGQNAKGNVSFFGLELYSAILGKKQMWALALMNFILQAIFAAAKAGLDLH